MRISFVLAFLLLSAITAFAQSTTYELINLDSSYRVTYVKLDLQARPDTEVISGSALLRSVSKGIRPDSTIELSMESLLTADSVFQDGIATTASHVGHRLFVKLLHRVGPGVLFDVQVFYHGYARSGAYIHATHPWPKPGLPIIWTASESFGARVWWPCKDNPAEKIDSVDMIVTCDAPNSIASNGVLESVTQKGNKRTFHWHESYPIDHYLVAFACTQYDTLMHLHQFANGVQMPVVNYVFPVSRDTMPAALRLLDTILDTYTGWFGQYPFDREKYGIAMWHGGGMENQSLSFCNDAGFELNAHEAAHQWFGDAVTCKTWSDLWVNEGFATYITDLFTEARRGERAFDTLVHNQEKHVTSQPGGSLYVPDSLWLSRLFDSRIVYDKGGLVLNMLRFVIGDDSTFFRALREYVTGPLRYGVATTDDFRRSVERTTGLDLKQFFQQWIYDEGYPIYDVQWNASDPLHPAVAVAQKGSNWDSPVFAMPMEFRFEGVGLDTTIRVFNDRPLQVYTFDLKKPVTKMTFDPHNRLLDGADPRTLGVATAAATVSTLRASYSHDVLHLNYSLAVTGRVEFAITDLLGRQIASVAPMFQEAGERERESIGAIASGAYFIAMKVDGKLIAITKLAIGN